KLHCPKTFRRLGMSCGRRCGPPSDRAEWNTSAVPFKRRGAPISSDIHGIATETGRSLTKLDFHRKDAPMNRRTFMTTAAAAIAMPTLSRAQLAAQHPVRLVLVHGRSQQGRKPAELQSVWLDTLKQGAAKLNRTLPDRLDVAFPFYGDRLDEFAKQRDVPL